MLPRRFAFSTALGLAVTALASPPLTQMSEVERRALAARLTPEALSELAADTAPIERTAVARRVLTSLGSYRYRMIKQERIKGTLRPDQEIDVFIRPEPLAIRLHYVKGPATGRRVLYNPSVRPDEFRVHEAGFFSIAGALWINTTGALAYSDSNHPVMDTGIGPLLTIFERDQARAASLNAKFTVIPEGFDARGHWCTMNVAPGGGYYAPKTRICTDLITMMPMKVECFDEHDQLNERFVFSDVRGEKQTEEFFDPEKSHL